jgi:argininosuccinate lyase
VFSEKIGEDILTAITLDASVNARSATGGTAPVRVREEIERAKQRP